MARRDRVAQTLACEGQAAIFHLNILQVALKLFQNQISLESMGNESHAAFTVPSDPSPSYCRVTAPASPYLIT